ncbi:hypothetical protein CRE_24051 [Caenorhabditis remanei]|uniref:Uncharacterized protein n=1 Tax=Caenorhabditis remanei TaxID=31234 RepID=E3MVI4_CAERE|nr:hypothetical protein CRE_24051 [Caenorhabditis remanei]
MLTRQPDLDLMSTYEIRKWRKEEVKRIRLLPPEDNEDKTAEIRVMTAAEVQDYLVTNCKTLVMLQSRLLKMSALQKIETGYVQLLQIHAYVKLNETGKLKPFLKECMNQNGPNFINRLIKYISQVCYDVSDSKQIRKWSNMMANLTMEYDWLRAFNGSVLASPDKEASILGTCILLLPNPSSKHATRVFASMAKEEKLPGCFELLTKRAFKYISSSAFVASDIEIVAAKYLKERYAECWEWKRKNKRKFNSGQAGQQMLIERTFQIAKKAFGIIKSSDTDAAQKLLDNPHVQLERPSDLFIEYFLQYTKLGMFNFENGDKLMAWNYYYDDRWCGYDRSDLFGVKPYITEGFHWFADFKYAGTIKQHPHTTNLYICAKVYEWMTGDEELYERLMNEYVNEDLVQSFAISLSFAGYFKLMIRLYDEFNDRIKSPHGKLCLALCYMYSCAKEAMATEALKTWVTVMEIAVNFEFLHTLEFPPNSFPLPYFVGMKNAGQFACRLLRNCLWTSAMKLGTEGWKKYGLIILHLCDSLETSFLNHNMMRIMFQKIDLKDMHLIVQPALAKCLRQHHNYWDCLQIARSREFEIPESCLKVNLLPERKRKISPKLKEENEEETVGFLVVYNKLRELDEIFYGIVPDVPMNFFRDVQEEKMNAIPDLPAESQEYFKQVVEYNLEEARVLENKKREMEQMESDELKELLEKLAKYYDGGEPDYESSDNESEKDDSEPEPEVDSDVFDEEEEEEYDYARTYSAYKKGSGSESDGETDEDSVSSECSSPDYKREVQYDYNYRIEASNPTDLSDAFGLAEFRKYQPVRFQTVQQLLKVVDKENEEKEETDGQKDENQKDQKEEKEDQEIQEDHKMEESPEERVGIEQKTAEESFSRKFAQYLARDALPFVILPKSEDDDDDVFDMDDIDEQFAGEREENKRRYKRKRRYVAEEDDDDSDECYDEDDDVAAEVDIVKHEKSFDNKSLASEIFGDNLEDFSGENLEDVSFEEQPSEDIRTEQDQEYSYDQQEDYSEANLEDLSETLEGEDEEQEDEAEAQEEEMETSEN